MTESLMTWCGVIPVLMGVVVSLGMPGQAGAWGPSAGGAEGSQATDAETGAAPVEVADADGDASVDPLGQGLVVKVVETMPEREQVRGWIEERGFDVLGRSGRVLERVDLIRVVVKGGPFDYGISLQVRRKGSDLPEQPEPIVCACGSEEMLDEVGKAIEVAAERLAETAEAERRAEQAALIATSEAECRVRTEDAVSFALALAAAEEQRHYRLTGLGAGGLVSLGLGTGLFMGGLGLTQYFQSSQAEWNNGARAMVTIGSLAFVGGLTMLVFDIARCKRGSAQCGRLGGEQTVWRRRPAWAAGLTGGRG